MRESDRKAFHKQFNLFFRLVGGKGNAFMEVANESAVNHHSRQKRATCDLASGANLNHTLCAAHCIMRGFRGGYCNDKAVCVCRK